MAVRQQPGQFVGNVVNNFYHFCTYLDETPALRCADPWISRYKDSYTVPNAKICSYRFIRNAPLLGCESCATSAIVAL
jgi:hypothetical protein